MFKTQRDPARRPGQQLRRQRVEVQTKSVGCAPAWLRLCRPGARPKTARPWAERHTFPSLSFSGCQLGGSFPWLAGIWGFGDPGRARSRAATSAKASLAEAAGPRRGPADVCGPGHRPGSGSGWGAYLVAAAVPARRAEQPGVWPGREQGQGQGRRGAGGGGAQEPGGARPDPGAHPACRAQQRQQRGHGAQLGAAPAPLTREAGGGRGEWAELTRRGPSPAPPARGAAARALGGAEEACAHPLGSPTSSAPREPESRAGGRG